VPSIRSLLVATLIGLPPLAVLAATTLADTGTERALVAVAAGLLGGVAGLFLTHRLTASRTALAQAEAEVEALAAERRVAEASFTEQAARLAELDAETAKLAAELNHRVKNLFQVAASIVTLSARGAPSPGDGAKAARERIEALSRVHMLTLGRGRGSEIMLDKLVASVLAPFRALPGIGVETEGPSLRLPESYVTPLSLILHEMAMGAARDGTLSRPGGRLKVAWEATDGAAGPGFRLVWQETLPDDASPPGEPEGFGATVLAGMVARLKAEITREATPDGLAVTLAVPLPEEAEGG